MKLKKSCAAVAAAVLTMVAGVKPAYAGCLDDAGDVIGAFVTGGASYAVCEAVETIESMIRLVRSTAESMGRMVQESIDAATGAVRGRAQSLTRMTNALMEDIGKKANEAQRLVAPATSGGARPPVAVEAPTKLLTPKPAVAVAAAPKAAAGPTAADARELERALREGAEYVGRVHSELHAHVARHLLGAAEMAVNHATRGLEAARRVGEVSLLAPLRELEQMLNELLRDPARIFDPSALVRESIERLTRAMTQVAEQIHREITQEALATLRDADQHRQRLIADAWRVARVHHAMMTAHRERTDESLRALRAALSSVGAGGSATADSTPRSAALQALAGLDLMAPLASTSTAAARQAAQQAAALKTQSDKLAKLQAQGLQAKLPPAVEQRAKEELARQLQGKSAAEAEAYKRQLKAQLAARYQGNAKVQDSLNREFEGRFAAVLRANPALLKPLAPVNVQPAPAQR